jgi:hypothetical protein
MGNIIEYLYYSLDSNLLSKSVFKYDDKGKVIEDSYIFLADSTSDFKITRKYDDKGVHLESDTYKFDGSLKSKTTYRYDYDSTGNWIKQYSYNGESKTPESITEREIIYY